MLNRKQDLFVYNPFTCSIIINIWYPNVLTLPTKNALSDLQSIYVFITYCKNLNYHHHHVEWVFLWLFFLFLVNYSSSSCVYFGNLSEKSWFSNLVHLGAIDIIIIRRHFECNAISSLRYSLLIMAFKTNLKLIFYNYFLHWRQ